MAAALPADPAAGGQPWRPGALAPAPGVRLLRLGEHVALFCERSQQLVELNPTAELIWSGLAAGRGPGEVAAELEALGAAPADAAAFVHAGAEAWVSAGQLVPAAAMARLAAPPTEARRLRLGDLAVRLSLHLDPADDLPARLDTVFGQFATRTADGPELAVVADPAGYILLADGQPQGLFARDAIVPAVKAILTERLSRAVGEGAFLLHAGLLAHDRKGLLVVGQPGAGKTTLTLALAARGLGYGSDDIVRVAADGALAGVPFSPAAKSGAWELAAPYVPAIRDLPTDLRADGQQVRYIPTAGFALGAVDRLGWVLLLARRPGARAALEPVEPLEALTELIGGAFSADHRARAATLAAFADQLAAADCRRLVYSDLTEAVGAVEALVRG